MIALGADHGGFQLKNAIKKHLESKGIACKDFGTNSKESVDYPNFALAVAKSVKSGECSEGILCCGTGIGISIAANKVPGIRAALAGDVYSAKMTKEHNNSNILCLGERVVGEGLALMIVDTWLESSYVGAHHQKRLDLLAEIEDTKWC